MKIKYVLTISILSIILIWAIGGCAGCKKVPVVSSISPDSGSEKGGDTVTITGDKFKEGAAVAIGGNPATNVNVVSNTEITAVTPAGTAGTTVGVEVRNEGVEEPGTLANAFTYLDKTPCSHRGRPVRGVACPAPGTGARAAAPVVRGAVQQLHGVVPRKFQCGGCRAPHPLLRVPGH